LHLSKGEQVTTSKKLLIGVSMAAFFVLASSAFAQETVLSVEIKDHRFNPAELHAPANAPIVLNIKNLDPTPEEFESKHLRVEKVIAGGAAATIHVRPLAPGRYRFFGDYHEATAEGFLIIE
jgi:hypothetical protein